MATRQNKTERKAAAMPTTPAGWNSLLSKAIQKAAAKGDPRLAGLKRAMIEGTAEKVLRKFGILSDIDLAREFPE